MKNKGLYLEKHISLEIGMKEQLQQEMESYTLLIYSVMKGKLLNKRPRDMEPLFGQITINIMV